VFSFFKRAPYKPQAVESHSFICQIKTEPSSSTTAAAFFFFFTLRAPAAALFFFYLTSARLETSTHRGACIN
jgi:hypothetical protein